MVIEGIEPPPIPLDSELVFYYHLDHLGTPLALTAKNQDKYWFADYLPFGEIYSEIVVSASNDVRFPGQYYDRETGLYYNWHRYYKPTLGRYYQADPIGQEGGINLYSYVINNPVSLADPSGLQCKEEGKCPSINWYDKLEQGYYYGTGFGEEAVQWYAEKYVQTGKWYYAFGGSVATLWTQEMWIYTASSIAGMGITQVTGLSAKGPWIGKFGLHPPHHGMGKHLEFILKLPWGKCLKIITPGKETLIWLGIR